MVRRTTGGLKKRRRAEEAADKQPAPIYDEQGDEFDVPQVTIDAIESFQVPGGFQQQGSREESFLFSLGNYYEAVGVVSKNSAAFKAFYKCQVGTCRLGKKTIPCAKGSRSNVNKHHREVHKLRGSKGQTRQANLRTSTSSFHQAMEAKKTFSVGETRCVFFLGG